MPILFVHKNFPAQFGHIAGYLIKQKGYPCSFLSETPPGMVAGIYQALKPLVTRLRPDLIVGHSGFGSTLFLPELFPGTPMINYCEYFYHPHNSDMDFHPPVASARRRPAALAHAQRHDPAHLEYCAAGYSPTEFEAGLMPAECRAKVRVLHDGIDTEFWQRRPQPERTFGKLKLSPDRRSVTYVSRGLESLRGFDIYMRAAKNIYTASPKAVILIVGSARLAYGGDLKFIQEKDVREHMLKPDDYDPNHLLFLGPVSPAQLARLFSLSDLHLYLTVPFVLSWSLPDALASGCTVLASDTAPLREFIRDGATGLLRNFFDADGLAASALEVLKDPGAYRHLGRAGEKLIGEQYSLHTIIRRMTESYEEVADGRVGRRPARNGNETR